MNGASVATPLETFGGLCDTVDRNDLPPWMAREATNCVWKPGSVEKRPGFTTWYTVTGYSVAGLFSFAAKARTANPSGRELVQVFSNGRVRARGAGGAALWADGGADIGVNAAVVPSAVQIYDSLTLALSDGNRAVGPCGLFRYPYSDSTDPIWYRSFIESPPVGLSLTQVAGGGSMTAGTHTAWATFELIDGTMSPPTAASSVTVNSNDRMTITFPGVVATAVPDWLGTIAIHLWVSPSGDTQNGYFVATVTAADLPYTFGLSDGVLTTAEKMDKAALSRTAAPMLSASVAGPYKGRLCYVGAPHRYSPGPTAATRTKNTTFAYGGGRGWTGPATGGSFPVPGQYRITFDGSASVRGLLTNDGVVVSDLAGRASIGATTFTSARWGVRVMVRKSAGLTGASLRVGMSSAIGAGSWQQDTSVSSIGTDWTLLEITAPGTTWGNDGKLFLQGVGPGVNGQYLDVSLIEAYDPGSRWAEETVWWSRPGLPREVDMTWGPVTVAGGTGQKLRFGFTMGDRFYYVTDRSIWATADNGGEPSQWPLELVAEGVGTPSFHGVGEGADWKVIAGPEGCWLFTGGTVTEDANLAREIKALWGRIAWEAYGHLVTVRVMHSLRQVWIGVPLDNATQVSHLLVLDFSEGFSTGLSSGGVGRRWSVWTIAPTGAPLEFLDSAGERRSLLPLGDKVGSLTEGSYADATAGYSFAWESGPIGAQEGGLGLFRKLLFSAEGNGLLTPSLVREGGQLVTLVSQTLYSPRRGDHSLIFSVSDERVGMRFEQGATASTWVRLSRAVLSWMPRPFGNRRPYNP